MRRNLTAGSPASILGDMDEPGPPKDDILDLLRSLAPLVEFEPAASEGDIVAAERGLGLSLPDELRTFRLASDGVTTGIELNSGEVLPHVTRLVWSVAEITRNREPQPLVPQPPHILFFADAGVDGILFGHPIYSPSSVGPDVVWWDPLDHRLVPAAPSFRAWLQAWLPGALTV